MLTIPVTSYVEAFIAHKFGRGPYFIGQTPKHPLRIEFLSTAAQAPKYLSVHTLGRIYLDIGDSRTLQEAYTRDLAIFQRGVFGLHMFWAAFLHEVVASQGFHESTYRAEIAAFQQRYQLDDETYQLENLERQFRREMVRYQISQPQPVQGIQAPAKKFPWALAMNIKHLQ